MLVKELIEELEKFDPDLDICVPSSNNSYMSIDVYFKKDQGWNRYGDSIHDILMMYGRY